MLSPVSGLKQIQATNETFFAAATTNAYFRMNLQHYIATLS